MRGGNQRRNCKVGKERQAGVLRTGCVLLSSEQRQAGQGGLHQVAPRTPFFFSFAFNILKKVQQATGESGVHGTHSMAQHDNGKVYGWGRL